MPTTASSSPLLLLVPRLQQQQQQWWLSLSVVVALLLLLQQSAEAAAARARGSGASGGMALLLLARGAGTAGHSSRHAASTTTTAAAAFLFPRQQLMIRHAGTTARASGLLSGRPHRAPPLWPPPRAVVGSGLVGGGGLRLYAATGGGRNGKGESKESGSGSNSSDGSESGEETGGAGAAGGGVRINKCFAAFASRREADKFVAAGRVRVNGEVAEPGARVRPGDRVTLDGKPVPWEAAVGVGVEGEVEEERDGASGTKAGGRVYIKYWKPRGVICTTDESIHGNIVHAVDYPGARIFPVGRLDKESTGLILLTNDGRVPNAVLRSSLNHRKTYKVRLNRPIDDADLAQLRSGVTITTPVQRDRVDRLVTAKTLPCEVTRLGARVFEIVLREGRNRQIRRMAEALGYRVLDLHREKVMDIDLRGLRGEGQWRALDKGEMGMIREALRVYEAAARGEGGNGRGGGGGGGRYRGRGGDEAEEDEEE